MSQRRGKYNARPVTWYGIQFDSHAEGERYLKLREKQDRGEITALEVHPVFVLEPPFIYRGKRIQAITYAPDFTYQEGRTLVAEDVKGGKATQTEVFRLKAKLFKRKYPQYDFRIVEG